MTATTELQHVDQAQQNQTAVVASQPTALLPEQSQAVNDISAYTSFEEAVNKFAKRPTITPPSTKEINKQMWVSSFMVAIMAGLASGNPAGAILGGMWGAIAVHDYGNELQQRGEGIADLEKAGYSYPAILKWYVDGDTSGLDKERKAKLDEARFVQQGVQFDKGLQASEDRMRMQIDAANDRTAAQIAAANNRTYAQIDAANQRHQQSLGVQIAQAIEKQKNEGKLTPTQQVAMAKELRDKQVSAQQQENSLIQAQAQVRELLGRDLTSGFGMGQGYYPNDLVTSYGQYNQGLFKAIKSQQYLSNAGTLQGSLTDTDAKSLMDSTIGMEETDGEAALRQKLEALDRNIQTKLEQNRRAANVAGVQIDQTNLPTVEEIRAAAIEKEKKRREEARAQANEVLQGQYDKVGDLPTGMQTIDGIQMNVKKSGG